MSVQPRFHVLVPAAGSGSRAGTKVPKQYQPLAGHPMVWHTLRALARVSGIETLGVVISPGDTTMAALVQSDPELRHVHIWPVGGDTRAASVQAGLRRLAQIGASPTDWVLVHDAARCLIQPEWVQSLITQCQSDPVGGLLAMPLPDTLKQADGRQRVSATLPREGKWLAQTPQMFKLGPLTQALDQAGLDVTDEASAMEAMGSQPLLVQGSAMNFKVTYADDFRWAEWTLAARKERNT